MHVIGHQAVRLERNAVVRQELCQQSQIEAAVFVAVKDLLSIVTTLGDMVRKSRSNQTKNSWHPWLSRGIRALFLQRKTCNEVFDTDFLTPIFLTPIFSDLTPIFSDFFDTDF